MIRENVIITTEQNGDLNTGVNAGLLKIIWTTYIHPSSSELCELHQRHEIGYVCYWDCE